MLACWEGRQDSWDSQEILDVVPCHLWRSYFLWVRHAKGQQLMDHSSLRSACLNFSSVDEEADAVEHVQCHPRDLRSEWQSWATSFAFFQPWTMSSSAGEIIVSSLIVKPPSQIPCGSVHLFIHLSAPSVGHLLCKTLYKWEAKLTKIGCFEKPAFFSLNRRVHTFIVEPAY